MPDSTRIAVVVSYDSYLRAARRVVECLSELHAEVQIFELRLEPNQLSNRQRASVPILTPRPWRVLDPAVATRPETFLGWDVLIWAASPFLLRQLLTAVLQSQANRRRPIIVTLFPGLLEEHRYRGFLSRASADLILVDSPRNLAYYRQLAADLRFSSDNAYLVGLTSTPAGTGDDAPSRDRLLFIEQPAVPRERALRRHLARRLADLARARPEVLVVIKPRVGPREKSPQVTRFPLVEELATLANPPPNLVADSSELLEQIPRAERCLSISSTGLLQALAMGCPVGAISDFGIRPHFGNDLFLGSGLLVTFDQLIAGADPRPDRDWLADNVLPPDASLAGLPDELARVRRRITADPTPPNAQLLDGATLMDGVTVPAFEIAWWEAVKAQLPPALLRAAKSIPGFERLRRSFWRHYAG